MALSISRVHAESSSDEHALRVVRIEKRRKLYAGEHPPSLEISDDGIDDNVTIGNTGTIIDAGVDFLFGKGVQFSVEDSEAGEELLADHQVHTILRELGLSGAYAGHAAVKLRIDTVEGVVAEVVDPATLCVVRDPDNYRQVEAYVIEYTTIDEHGQCVAKRETTYQEGAGWRIKLEVARAEQVVGMGAPRSQAKRVWQEVSDEAWGFAWPPIIDCQNLPAPGEYYGASDIASDIQDANRAVNRNASNINKTLRHFAHPIPVGTGFSAAELQTAIGAMLVLPSKDASLRNLEMQSDGAFSLAFFHLLDAKQFEQARVPGVALGKIDGAGSLSGVALEILYRPLLAKTDTKREAYGKLLTTLASRILEAAGIGQNLTVKIVWPDALPKNQKERSETAINLKAVGVSFQTICESLGIDFQQEKARLEEEARDPFGDAFALKQMLDEARNPAPEPAEEGV